MEVTTHPGGLESNPQGEGKQALHLQGRKEEHLVLQTKKLSCNTWQQLRKEGLESRDTSKGCKSGVRREALGSIPGPIRKNLEGGSWVNGLPKGES